MANVLVFAEVAFHLEERLVFERVEDENFSSRRALLEERIDPFDWIMHAKIY